MSTVETPTSDLGPEPTTEQVVQVDAPWIRFPPFPSVPEGVTIIPFKDYKETGILMFPKDDETEIDGLGIPTVELRVKHDTDECKTSVKRKKKQQARIEEIINNGPVVRKEWWEQWQEGEDLRTISANYDPQMSRIDRFYQAAADFRQGRSWPQIQTGVRTLWDQFRLFAGLLSNTPIWHLNESGKAAADDLPAAGEDDDNSEDELDMMDPALAPKTDVVVEDEAPDPAQKKWPSRKRPRPPYANFGAEIPELTSQEGIDELRDEETMRKEEKLNAFLNDPETMMKIFLSSYIRKQGLIWSDRNLVFIPQLVGFFLNFLVRNRVLPESTHERGFKRAIQIIEISKKELPLTSKAAKVMPDQFSMACKECWGSKADGYKSLLPDPEEEKEMDEEKEEEAPEKDDVEEPELKRAKLDFEEELKAANVEVISKDVERLDAPEVAIDNGWGSTGNWGSSENDELALDPWTSIEPNINWEAPVYSLMTFMGPTAFPLTHTTGVVEWSLRKIKAIVPLPEALPKGPMPIPSDDAEAVEAELERRFAKIVLGPWIGWDNGEEMNMARPKILESSRGAVVESEDDSAVADDKVHNPWKDDIILLVEAEVVKTLSVGMGIGATWIQLVREEKVGGEPAKKKKKSKSKAKKVVQQFWYLEEVMMIFPSYYTV